MIVDGCLRLLQCIKPVNNITKRSPTSKSCHPHISSPTFIISNVQNWSKINFFRKVGQNSFVASDFGIKIRISTMFYSFFNILCTVYLWYWVKIYYSLVLWQFCFFQGGQDILIWVKFLIFLKKTGNFGSGNLNHKLSPQTCLFHNRDSHLFNDKNLWKTRELRLFFSIFNLFKPKNQPRLRLRGEHLE